MQPLARWTLIITETHIGSTETNRRQILEEKQENNCPKDKKRFEADALYRKEDKKLAT